MASRSASRGIGEEFSHLRRRCAELEDKLRQLGTSDEQNSITRRPSFEDTLKSRTVQPFKINAWDNERKVSNVNSMEPETPGAGGLEIVAVQDAHSPLSNSRGKEEESIVPAANGSNSAVSARRRWSNTWIPQPRLEVGDCCDDPSCDSLFSGMRSELQAARFDSLLTKMDNIFEQHLQNFQIPHLRFSAALVSLYSILREGAMVALTASHSSRAFDDIDDHCLSRCANIARHFVRKARFQDTPPARRPAEVERSTYVRELCTQAGLSLDLCRIGVVHERLITDRSKSSTQTSQDTKNIGASSSPEGRSRKKTEVCVSREERLSQYERAGRYLAAVQMDMDRYRDEFESQREAILKSRVQTSAIEWVSTDIEHGLQLSPLPALGDATPATPENLESTPKSNKGLLSFLETQSSQTKQDRQIVLQQETSGGEVGQTQLALANAESGGEAGQKQLALANAETFFSAKEKLTDVSYDSNASDMSKREDTCVRDPLLISSFGEFLEKQVLPLYVADVSFRRLKALAENYCGITLDSDDERDAWKEVGLTKPVSTKNTRKKQRRETRAPLASNETSPQVATPVASDGKNETSPHLATPVSSDGKNKLTELRDLMDKSKSKVIAPVMRAQMQTSIVEKRSRGFRAFRDQEVQFQSQSKVAPLASPQIKTSRVLYEGSTPLSAAFASQRAAFPECSPLSMRKTSRGRLELQGSSRSTRSENRSRTPRTSGERQPDWDAM